MIGSLGSITFQVDNDRVFSLGKELSRSKKVKISEHTPIYGVPTIRHQGRDLVEINLSISLISSLGVDPKKEIEKIQDFMELGKFERLIIGKQVIGEFPFLIIESNETRSHFNRLTSEFDVIQLELKLVEYIEDANTYLRSLEYKKQESIALTEEDVKKIEKEQREETK